MKIFPAIDIKDKKCVRLVKGDFDNKTEYEMSPVEQAGKYKEHGFKNLHIVDLDGALTGETVNLDIIQEIKKNPSSKLNSIPEKSTSIISYEFKELNSPSPSLEDIRNLINGWLLSKSNYLAGKSEINLSKIVSKGLIDRTIEERQNDIKKGIYKEINSQIRKIDLESQTSSRIVVLVELNYLERIIKNSGELVNETSLTPLKVKYILGFSNKAWKLVDFVSGL